MASYYSFNLISLAIPGGKPSKIATFQCPFANPDLRICNLNIGRFPHSHNPLLPSTPNRFTTAARHFPCHGKSSQISGGVKASLTTAGGVANKTVGKLALVIPGKPWVGPDSRCATQLFSQSIRDIRYKISGRVPSKRCNICVSDKRRLSFFVFITK